MLDSISERVDSYLVSAHFTSVADTAFSGGDKVKLRGSTTKNPFAVSIGLTNDKSILLPVWFWSPVDFDACKLVFSRSKKSVELTVPKTYYPLISPISNSSVAAAASPAPAPAPLSVGYYSWNLFAVPYVKRSRDATQRISGIQFSMHERLNSDTSTPSPLMNLKESLHIMFSAADEPRGAFSKGEGDIHSVYVNHGLRIDANTGTAVLDISYCRLQMSFVHAVGSFWQSST